MINKCTSLNNIKIFDTGMINVNNYTSFFVFCLKNNINDLNKLFEYINNNDIVDAEVLGVVELLKYKYLNKYDKFEFLFVPINQVDNSMDDFKKILIGFGFAPFECDFLLNYLNKVDNVFNFGELFRGLCDTNIDMDSVLKNKISLLSDCYLKGFESKLNNEDRSLNLKK